MRRRHASSPASPADWVGNYLTQQSVHCVQLLESILEQVHHTADPGMCARVEWSGVRTAVPLQITHFHHFHAADRLWELYARGMHLERAFFSECFL